MVKKNATKILSNSRAAKSLLKGTKKDKRGGRVCGPQRAGGLLALAAGDKLGVSPWNTNCRSKKIF